MPRLALQLGEVLEHLVGGGLVDMAVVVGDKFDELLHRAELRARHGGVAGRYDRLLHISRIQPRRSQVQQRRCRANVGDVRVGDGQQPVALVFLVADRSLHTDINRDDRIRRHEIAHVTDSGFILGVHAYRHAGEQLDDATSGVDFGGMREDGLPACVCLDGLLRRLRIRQDHDDPRLRVELAADLLPFAQHAVINVLPVPFREYRRREPTARELGDGAPVVYACDGHFNDFGLSHRVSAGIVARLLADGGGDDRLGERFQLGVGPAHVIRQCGWVVHPVDAGWIHSRRSVVDARAFRQGCRQPPRRFRGDEVEYGGDIMQIRGEALRVEQGLAEATGHHYRGMLAVGGRQVFG